MSINLPPVPESAAHLNSALEATIEALKLVEEVRGWLFGPVVGAQKEAYRRISHAHDLLCEAQGHLEHAGAGAAGSTQEGRAVKAPMRRVTTIQPITMVILDCGHQEFLHGPIPTFHLESLPEWQCISCWREQRAATPTAGADAAS